jgi:hypothetical protein
MYSDTNMQLQLTVSDTDGGGIRNLSATKCTESNVSAKATGQARSAMMASAVEVRYQIGFLFHRTYVNLAVTAST